jgi:hypothetical protein
MAYRRRIYLKINRSWQFAAVGGIVRLNKVRRTNSLNLITDWGKFVELLAN